MGGLTRFGEKAGLPHQKIEEKMESTIDRIKSTSSVRSLPNVEKAMHLVQNCHCTFKLAASKCCVSESAIHRAITAVKKNRVIGVNGHPRIFQPAEEVQVVQTIAAHKVKNVGPTMNESRAIVRFTVHFNSHVFTKPESFLQYLESHKCQEQWLNTPIRIT